MECWLTFLVKGIHILWFWVLRWLHLMLFRSPIWKYKHQKHIIKIISGCAKALAAILIPIHFCRYEKSISRGVPPKRYSFLKLIYLQTFRNYPLATRILGTHFQIFYYYEFIWNFDNNFIHRYVASHATLKFNWKPVVYARISIFIFHLRCSSPDACYLDERNELIYLQK